MKGNKTHFVLEMRGYSIKELSAIYGIDRRTFKNWIQPFLPQIGERRGRYYNVNQVRIMVEKLGVPSDSE
jgi:transposase